MTDSVRSPALEGNLPGDSPLRPLLVYLPPSHAQDLTRRYPVHYLLHGFGGTADSWVNGNYQGLARRLTEQGLPYFPGLLDFGPEGM